MRSWMCVLRGVGCLVGIVGSCFFAASNAPGQAICSLPGATTVYSTGFEAPTFSTGPLNGQDGWLAPLPSSVIQNTVAFNSTQSLRLTHDSMDPNAGASRIFFVPIAPTTKLLSLSCDILFSSGESMAHLTLFTDNGMGFGAEISRVGGAYQLTTTSGATPPQPFPDGFWHHLEIILNLQTLTVTGTVDGTLLGTLPITGPVPTQIFQVSVGSEFPVAPTQVHFDNVSLCAAAISTCCDPVTGACETSFGATCANGANPNQFGTSCTPNPCPIGACCDLATLACAITGPLGCPGPANQFFPGALSCSAVVCPQGACCDLNSAACTITGPNGCPSPNLTFRGLNTTCTPTPCPQGACCDLATLACAVTGPLGCSGPNVTFLGGATCATANCPKGACCDLNSAACTITGPNGCPSPNLTFRGLNTVCTPTPCPQGACCDLVSIACAVTGPLGCSGPNVTFLGGATCATAICPQGACCDLRSAACGITGPNGCPSPNLTFRGLNTTCTPTICPQGACCDLISVACAITGPLGCSGPNLTFRAGQTCATVVCPQGACCDLLSAACGITGPNACTGPDRLFRGLNSTCATANCPQGACCDLQTADCAITGPRGCIGANLLFRPLGSTCTPNTCPRPTACCNLLTGVCSVSPAAVPCAAPSVAATPATSSCTPYPCAAVIASGVVACDDCTYFNGPADGRDGQLSHLGGASPHGSKAADDFYLCENFVYDLKTFSATIFTTTFPGLVKPKGEIWSDCGGCPGTLLYTFDNPFVLETGTDIGPAFDGRPLRVVHVTFDVTRESLIANKNVVLKGGVYWLSIYGTSDNLGPTMQMFDVTYWGSTGGTSHVIKGKPAHKIDGNAGNAYNVFTFPAGCGAAAWHSVADDCCIGCTDLNFSFCTTPCKVLIDNGAARVQSGGLPNGSTSQFAIGSGSPMETRSADDFLTPPCQFYNICYVEACVLTNCPTFEGIFEIYGNNCNKPSYALGGQPAANLQWTATKIVPLGAAYTSVIDGKTVFGYRLEFHDLNFGLNPGMQWWISVGVRYTFSINERAYFCFNQYCDSRCPIKYNEGRVLTVSTLDAEAAALGCVSPAPVVGCNGWAKTGNDFSFLIAGDGLTTPGPINGQPGSTACRVDINSDGHLDVQDVFDYLNSFFAGCP